MKIACQTRILLRDNVHVAAQPGADKTTMDITFNARCAASATQTSWDNTQSPPNHVNAPRVTPMTGGLALSYYGGNDDE